mmetsp:Transcript_14126/g.59519  ORF Transcript_14126/g.59519 Transcript_14126/m.59519 type:complete len:317 (-) Transcript_14126:619-1569(-)
MPFKRCKRSRSASFSANSSALSPRSSSNRPSSSCSLAICRPMFCGSMPSAPVLCTCSRYVSRASLICKRRLRKRCCKPRAASSHTTGNVVALRAFSSKSITAADRSHSPRRNVPTTVVAQLPPKGSLRIFVNTLSPWPANSLLCVASARTTPAKESTARFKRAPSLNLSTAGSIASGSAPGQSAITSVFTRCEAGVIVPSRSGRPGTYCETRRVRMLAARSCLLWPYSLKPVTRWLSAAAYAFCKDCASGAEREVKPATCHPSSEDSSTSKNEPSFFAPEPAPAPLLLPLWSLANRSRTRSSYTSQKLASTANSIA